MSVPSADDSDVKVNMEISEKVSNSHLKSSGSNSEKKNEADDHVLTFSIEPGEFNTAENRYKEATFVSPHLVKRIDSCEILPKPFKTTNQLIFAAVLSTVCCLCIGAYACQKAMKVKILRNKGLYAVAERKARYTCYLMIAAVVTSLIIVTILLTLFLTGVLEVDK